MKGRLKVCSFSDFEHAWKISRQITWIYKSRKSHTNVSISEITSPHSIQSRTIFISLLFSSYSTEQPPSWLGYHFLRCFFSCVGILKPPSVSGSCSFSKWAIMSCLPYSAILWCITWSLTWRLREAYVICFLFVSRFLHTLSHCMTFWLSLLMIMWRETRWSMRRVSWRNSPR